MLVCSLVYFLHLKYKGRKKSLLLPYGSQKIRCRACFPVPAAVLAAFGERRSPIRVGVPIESPPGEKAERYTSPRRRAMTLGFENGVENKCLIGEKIDENFMYEYIRGKVAEAAPTYAVIDVGGVGYHLQISLETFTAIEHAGEALLYTHYVVREDAQLLYGFATKVERELFRLLISVSGVGGNTARMILSTYSPAELQGIITAGNAVLLKNVKGLGLKTAQKIIVELTGKLTALGAEAVDSVATGGNADEAVEALVMLGFAKGAAEKVVRAVVRENPSVSVEELVRMSLKRF